MISCEILAKIKDLQIHTKRILNGSNLGSSRSSQKGFGFEFDQLRSYQYGDDVRLIDWKSSARSQNNGLLVRQYYEDRNRNIVICLDISASTYFGSGAYLKQDIFKQIAGALAFAGSWSQDRVGLVLFSDHIEKIIPPAKGDQHIHRLLQEMFTYRPVGQKTEFNVIADFVTNQLPKNTLVLLISDFIGSSIQTNLKKIAWNKEVVAIKYADLQEVEMANVGYVWIQDLETNEIALVNSSGVAGRKIKLFCQNQLKIINKELNSCGIEVLQLQNPLTFIHDLLIFFQKRMA